jgi:hypothetical protein
MKIQPGNPTHPDSAPASKSWLLLVMKEPEPEPDRPAQLNALPVIGFPSRDREGAVCR